MPVVAVAVRGVAESVAGKSHKAGAQAGHRIDGGESCRDNIVGDLEETTGSGRVGEACEAHCAYVDDAWTVTGCKTATGSSTVNTVRQDQNWLRKQSIGNISTDRIENCVVCF